MSAAFSRMQHDGRVQSAVSRHHATRVGLCIATLLAAEPAFAETESDDESASEVVEVGAPSDAEAAAPQAEADEPGEPDPIEVRVIGEKADAIQKVPGSGTVIRPKDIQSAEPQDVAEMLRRVPGLNVRQDEGAGGRLDIGIRGLDPGRSRRVLMLEDGIPLSINPYAEPDMYYAPPIERMQGIEVVKGSGSILFGPQTTGGVINFLSKPAPYQRRVSLAAYGGQRGFFRGVGSYGDTYRGVRHLTQLVFLRGDGFRGIEFAKLNALGKVAFETSDRGEATIKVGFHDETSIGDDVGLTAAMFAQDPRRATLQPDNQIHLRRYDVSVVHEHRFDEHVSLKTLAYGYITERQWQRQLYDRFPVQGVHYARIVGDTSQQNGAIYFRDAGTVLDRSYQVAGLEPRLQLRFDTAGVGHTLDIGARVLGEAAQYEQRATERATSSAGELVLDESRSSLAFASYVQDRMGFLDDLLLVTPGVRFEHVAYDRDIRRQLGADGARDVDIRGESSSRALVPGIGITAGTPEIHGFAGFHVGFAPPRVTSSINANGIDEELDAEQSFAYEAGGRLRVQRVLALELTGYLTNYSNQVVPSTDGAVTALVNGGATQILGMETGATLSFGKLIQHGVLLDVATTYNLGQAQFVGGDNDGRQLPYAPNHKVSTTLDIGHAIGVAAQLAYTFVGPQFTDDQNTREQDITGRAGRIDGYHVIDANLRYKNRETGLTAILSAKNLADDIYIIARRPEGIFASGFRQITAGLRWDYEEAPPSASP